MGVDVDIKAIHEKVKLESAFVERLKREVQKVIVGQEYMIDRLLIGILCEGHLLLEGVPGWRRHLRSRLWLVPSKLAFSASSSLRISYRPT